MAKILVLDIETAPKLAYVWRFFKENISPKQVKEHCRILSYAAKWIDSDEIIYEESRGEDDFKLVKKLVGLLDDADIVVAHNGQAFDLSTIRGRALANGLAPPSPFKTVDTLLTARKEFNFESNSLEYLAIVLKCKNRKLAHSKFPGFELWLQCLKGNKEAWTELKTYNIMDVLVLEEVYLKMRPYMSSHPNVSLYNSKVPDSLACTRCDSHNIQKRGYYHTMVSRYQKYVCLDCGSWSRTRFNLVPQEGRKFVTTPAV